MILLLNQILRGMVIGLANIIPGVSGGTMMVSMGIYDTLIHCITHLFSEFIKSIKTLLPYAIGMVVAIVALASLLTVLMRDYALPTSTAFIGLILGGLSPLLHKISLKKVNWVAVLLFLAFFALVILLALQGFGEQNMGGAIELDIGQVLMLVVIGAIASATMLIPGVSGSMMLMLLGYYGTVIGAIENLKNAVIGGEFSAAVTPFLTLLPFGIGIIIGIFGVAKLIEWLLSRYPTYTYCAVLGLVIASPIAILLKTDMTGVGWTLALVSLVTFAAGFIAAALLAKGSGQNEVRQRSKA